MNLYSRLCSYENLELAWRKARKRKTQKDYVLEFESNLEGNLQQLKHELETLTYSPAPLKTFIVRDPKTRRISASQFKDRIVHHAICNVIEPTLSRSFIYDSFANQKGKGVHLAIRRLEYFIGKVYASAPQPVVCVNEQKNQNVKRAVGYALKADIKHYFETIDHETLLKIIEYKITDKNLLNLIRLILKNHNIDGKGMPLGNLTSQFFANVYLNEFDHFVKYRLKVKYYIRYVDDFVILCKDKCELEEYKNEIEQFLSNNLKIGLHPNKTRIIPLQKGITILGFRLFGNYRLLKKSNAKRIWKRIKKFTHKYDQGKLTKEEITRSIEGWFAYAKFANTHRLRKRVTIYMKEKRLNNEVQQSF